MKNRILSYYSLLLVWFLIFFFGPGLLQFLFELFFVLATVLLPYPGDFMGKALRKLPAFTALMLVAFAVLLGLLDFAVFFTTFTEYALLLLIVPLYVFFKMLTLPWVFLKRGLAAPIAALKVPNEANWTVLAVLSVMGLVNHVLPIAVPFLLAPSSFFLQGRLAKSGNL